MNILQFKNLTREYQIHYLLHLGLDINTYKKLTDKNIIQLAKENYCITSKL